MLQDLGMLFPEKEHDENGQKRLFPFSFRMLAPEPEQKLFNVLQVQISLLSSAWRNHVAVDSSFPLG